MFQASVRPVPVIRDGSVQTYLVPLDRVRDGDGDWQGPWQELGLAIRGEEPGAFDILSVSVIPKEASYAGAAAGVQAEVRHRTLRRTLYSHTPGRLEYRVRVPQGGRLDVGLGVLRDDAPVTFTISAQPAGEVHQLLEETHGDPGDWAQHSVDLSDLAGQTVTLVLEADAVRPGTVALWGAPTVSSARRADSPNIIFYVIDGGGADYMSAYGYNRRTTPNLAALAAEGALFEYAYSNASWTRPSTASFMTSLQHSVLGGFKGGFNVIPADAPTMAQHMHRAGYQTAVFTANPNAGRMSGLERGVDVFREDWAEFDYGGGGNYKESSRFLHEAFWDWREAYPAEPYWVHFQTTDVHEDFPAVAPFSGLFVGPDQLATWRTWQDSLEPLGNHGVYSEAWETSGLDRVEFFAMHQGLYDETMAHNDYQIGRLVARLKAEGEWENTLLIIGADHSIDAAMDDMGVAIQDTLPPRWSRPMLRASISRVPLIVVWPGHIAAGQRFSEPVVSMIDVLPTMLDLAGLPMPEVMQGQSLAPLVLGTGGVEPRPVILDMFRVDQEDGELRGTLEVIDGRWGASLEFNPRPPDEDDDEEEVAERRPVPLLLYDLWNDPWALWSVHEERPDLVEKYTTFLEAQFEAHQALAQLFTASESVALTPEQLETLRALGYIQ
jgi:arylsulfatase A-like enzyme